MGEVLVTAERIAYFIKNHPQDVAIVDRKEIIRRGLSDTEEVLKTMPGVEVNRSTGTGSRISLRGSGKSGGVLVLLNGRPLNTNQYGGVDLSSIPIEMIESVTVFKPPVPVWLGPGAGEGAINIQTRDLTLPSKEKKNLSTTITTSGGSFGLAQGSASQLLPFGGGKLLLTGSASHRDGKRQNTDMDDATFSAYWNRDGRDGRRYEVNSRYYTAYYGSSGPTDNPTPDARQRYSKSSIDGRFAGLLGEKGNYSLTPYLDLTDVTDHPQSGLTSTLTDLKAGLKGETVWSDPAGLWDFRLGGMTEHDDLDHTLTGHHQRTMVDLSANHDRRFGSFTGSLGLRGTYTSDFGMDPGISGGLGYAVSEKSLMRAKAGYSVSVPTFSQLYQTSHGSIDQVRGNPDLKSERTWSYDIGVEHRFDKNNVLHASIFRSDTRNFISSLRGADKIYRPVNVDWAWRQGVEVTFKWAQDVGLGGDANLILQDSRSGETCKEVPYTPRGRAKATIQYTFSSLKTRVEVTGRYEGSRFSEAEGLPSQELHDYSTFDMKAIQPFSTRFSTGELFVKVENLLDRSFDVHFGFPDDGIRFNAGIQVRF
jgi:iron complex outermembrane receptor protein